MVPVKTENFYLKEIESDDIEHIFKGLSNHEITRYYDVHFSSLKETEEQMKWYKELKEQGTGIWWGIYRESDDEFCGAAGFNGHVAEHKKAEIGMWLLTEHWGKGILPEVLPALFEYGFEKLDLNRIEGLVDRENSKCKRALEKINFVHEGTLREYEIKDGRNVDLDVYAILKNDWKLIKMEHEIKLDFLDHVAIRVNDIEASAEWYRKVLGLKKYQLPEWGAFPIFMLAGKSGIALFPANPDDPVTDPESRNVRIDHFAFNVTRENFEKAKLRYRDLGLEFDLQDHHYFDSIYTRDPDGHKVELTTIKVDANKFYSGP